MKLTGGQPTGHMEQHIFRYACDPFLPVPFHQISSIIFISDEIYFSA